MPYLHNYANMLRYLLKFHLDWGIILPTSPGSFDPSRSKVFVHFTPFYIEGTSPRKWMMCILTSFPCFYCLSAPLSVLQNDFSQIPCFMQNTWACHNDCQTDDDPFGHWTPFLPSAYKYVLSTHRRTSYILLYVSNLQKS